MISATVDVFKGSILIVDDEAPNVLLLERALRGAGYTSVASTMDPSRVAELCRLTRYDLILLDIRMPGMDGFQVMESLKTLGAEDGPDILVVTADPEQKQRALDAGAKDFVSKPFVLVEVLTRVRNLMEAQLLQRELAEHREDNPALSSVMQRNIRKIIQIRSKAILEQSPADRIANALTSFSGRMAFVYVHIAWFALWLLLNTGRFGVRPFDPYPYEFLTMVVSLEAIFLATFVLISQNLMAKEAARLTDLFLQTSLLTEHELTRVLQMLRAVQRQIGIRNDEDSDRADADLEMETRPEDVLAEIERLARREARDPRREGASR